MQAPLDTQSCWKEQAEVFDLTRDDASEDEGVFLPEGLPLRTISTDGTERNLRIKINPWHGPGVEDNLVTNAAVPVSSHVCCGNVVPDDKEEHTQADTADDERLD